MKLKHVLHLLLAVVPAAAVAAPTSKQIDSTLTACLSKSEGVTIRMKDCLSDAYQAMDARLNTVYQRLLKQLSHSESASLLRDAQRKWLSYRNAESKFANATDPNQGGTLQAIASADLAYAMVKERTTALERYLESASDVEAP
jgi:uncharacterized protein YecT (DUF1311 family)